MDIRERMIRRRAIMDTMERDTNENADVTFSELGNVFRYVFTSELPVLAKNHGEGEAPHFYAMLAYLYLNNLVSCFTASRSRMIMLFESSGEESVKDVIRKVSKCLLDDLKNQIRFNNFDELVEQLNHFSIDRWYFDIGKQLIHSYELDSFLFNGMLYYIGRNKEENDNALLKISVKRINSETDLSDDDNAELLVDGFDSILAFDDKNMRIYLEMYDQENYFAYYDMLKDELVICRNRFFALVDGTVWVITQDNWIAFVIGDTVHRIKEYHEGEDYDERKDCFYVHPIARKKTFFYPYYLFFDGRVLLADKKDYGNVLWDYLSKNILGNDSSPFSTFGLDVVSEKKAPIPEEFSINNIMSSLNKAISKEHRCTNFKYILLENIFDILRKYLNPDKDYTKLWFTLGEANSYLSHDGAFPSEELYWRLKEMDIENASGDKSIPLLLTNYDFLLVELIKEKKYGGQLDFDNCSSKSMEEEIDILLKKDSYHEDSGKIGTFLRNKDVISSIPISYEDGMFVGSQIIPKVDFSREYGIVIYDAHFRRSFVICDYELDMNERLKLMKDFHLDEGRVTFVYQRKVH